MLGMGARGICVLGALLWSGAGLANAQTLSAPTGNCAASLGETAPRKVPAPTAKGIAQLELDHSTAPQALSINPIIITEPERVVEIWRRPEPAPLRGFASSCAPRLQNPSARIVLED